MRISQKHNPILISLITSACLLLAGCEDAEVEEDSSGIQDLSFDMFVTEVNPILTKNIDGKRCSSSGCHNNESGTGGNFRLFDTENPTDVQLRANYISAISFTNVSAPRDSILLLEPTAGSFPSTGGHAGGDIFFPPDDENYQTLLEWISTPATPVEGGQ
jgi:hypothetical protein|tara:strand:+ start:9369 stop:9848 length:480 start_codon:yes stop_codon:yes gene_type:complete